eukprot:5412008-Pleurochrysis_carterae.AAC.1
MIVSKERLEAVLNLSRSGVAQVVDLKVLGHQVVEAQRVAEAEWQRIGISQSSLAITRRSRRTAAM